MEKHGNHHVHFAHLCFGDFAPLDAFAGQFGLRAHHVALVFAPHFVDLGRHSLSRRLLQLLFPLLLLLVLRLLLLLRELKLLDCDRVRRLRGGELLVGLGELLLQLLNLLRLRGRRRSRGGRERRSVAGGRSGCCIGGGRSGGRGCCGLGLRARQSQLLLLLLLHQLLLLVLLVGGARGHRVAALFDRLAQRALGGQLVVEVGFDLSECVGKQWKTRQSKNEISGAKSKV
jgi:hypothetical protein